MMSPGGRTWQSLVLGNIGEETNVCFDGLVCWLSSRSIGAPVPLPLGLPPLLRHVGLHEASGG